MDKSLIRMAFSSHQTWYYSIVNALMYELPTAQDASASPLSSSLIYTYHHAIHGFSAYLTLDKLETLKKVCGFVVAHSDMMNFMSRSTSTPEYLSLNPVSVL